VTLRAGQVRKLALFVLIPLIAAAAPLIAIPTIAARYGADGWACVAIALGVGNAGLIVAEVGWGVVGPQRIARADADRRTIWEAANASRILSVAATAPVAALVAALATPSHRGTAALLAAALVLGALSATWFFIGSGRPGLVLLSDTVPRTSLTLGAATGIGLGGPLWLYAAGIAAGALVMLIITATVGKLPLWPSRAAFRAVPATIRAHAFLSFGRMISTFYTSLPATFLGFVAPSAVAAFTASDRPMRMGFTLLGSVTARLQSWMGAAAEDERNRRGRYAVMINGCLGILAGTAFVVGMPLVAPLLFGDAVHVPTSLTVLTGVTVFIMCISSALGLCLVAIDRASDISFSIITAALTGVPTILTLGTLAGAEGAAVGVLLAEIVGALTQIAFLARGSRKRTLPRAIRAFPYVEQMQQNVDPEGA